MVDLANPAVVEAIASTNRKDSPELGDMDAILLAEMRRSCRLDIPLLTKEDFRKVSQVMADRAGRLALIASDRALTTLQALQTAKSDVDRANRLIKNFCPRDRSGDGVRETTGT